MKELDDELRHVLRREEPPPGFAEAVLRRVAEPRIVPFERKPMIRPSLTRWAAAAALVVALGGAAAYRAAEAREERMRGEAAKEQLMQALRITGSKLQIVQSAVKETGS